MVAASATEDVLLRDTRLTSVDEGNMMHLRHLAELNAPLGTCPCCMLMLD